MKKIILTIVFAISCTVLFAQNKPGTTDMRPKNNINLNFFGDASLISINYERLFLITPSFFITGKLGIGYNEEFQICIWGPCSAPEEYMTIPHYFTGNLGKERNFLEFGLGGTIINGNTNQYYFLYPIIGYRIQPLKSNKVNFRIFGSIPITDIRNSGIVFIPFGLSIGECF